MEQENFTDKEEQTIMTLQRDFINSAMIRCSDGRNMDIGSVVTATALFLSGIFESYEQTGGDSFEAQLDNFYNTMKEVHDSVKNDTNK